MAGVQNKAITPRQHTHCWKIIRKMVSLYKESIWVYVFRLKRNCESNQQQQLNYRQQRTICNQRRKKKEHSQKRGKIKKNIFSLWDLSVCMVCGQTYTPSHIRKNHFLLLASLFHFMWSNVIFSRNMCESN